MTTSATSNPRLATGVPGLDSLLGGGLEEGTACLLTGTTGTGKSTLASLYLQAAARRGMTSVAFCFDERRETFLRRCDSLGMAVRDQIDAGRIHLRQVDVGEMSPGEFAHVVRRAVEEKDARVVLIDSLSGYMHAMPEDGLLSAQLHELLNYLASRGVLTLLVVTPHNHGGGDSWDVDASYIADTVVTIRHFEAMGRIRRCLAVIKKRHGDHEKTIREFRITHGGCRVGEPLWEFNGVLSGNPAFVGDTGRLFGPVENEEGPGDEG